MLDQQTYEDRITGCLLGLAVGDAVGLPREGLSPGRATRLFGDGPLRHRLVLGRGMVSDDTEHHCMTAQALLASPDDDKRFARSLAWRLRGWFLGLPAAVGFATLRSILKLCVGFPPHRSGVFSAGNGPAMRAPILGACLGRDPALLRRYINACTRITHTDPRAEQGALAIALATWHGLSRGPHRVDPEAVIHGCRPHAHDDALASALQLIPHHLASGSTPADFAGVLGLGDGVTGFINHTVPMALYCWLKHPSSYEDAVGSVILLGGDTDTTAAIVGGISGATVGQQGIARRWLDGVADYPRSVPWIERLGRRVAQNVPRTEPPASPRGPQPLFWPAVLVRNLVFTLIVLGHGFRRLLPPY